ncbi:AAA family ATPase [Arthrobacter sp. KNU-44]|uniref:AAA family ATPase n=1 Tax=unclassified Arthrobacter TaxID=235627 RepID=UPI003F42F7B4
MYNSFTARNFRGFREAHLPELAQVNLITGLNDAGKTSLLEALFLHASGPFAAGNYLQVLTAGRGQGLGLETSGATSPWRDIFRNFEDSEPVELSARTGKGDLSVQIIADRDTSEGSVSLATLRGESKNAWSAGVIVRTKVGNEDVTDHRQSINVESSGGPIGNVASSINIALHLEPPAGEPFSKAAIVVGNLGPDLAQGYSELRRGKTSLDLLGSLREIDPRISNLEVLVQNGRPQLHADIDGTLVPFELLGEGVTAVAKYLLSMANCRDGLLLIDEVGAGVHHSVLPKLWWVLWRAAQRLNVQIVATTHSAECVRAAEGVLSKLNHALIVHRLRRAGEEEATKVISYGDEKLRTALKMNVELR